MVLLCVKCEMLVSVRNEIYDPVQYGSAYTLGVVFILSPGPA